MLRVVAVASWAVACTSTVPRSTVGLPPENTPAGRVCRSLLPGSGAEGTAPASVQDELQRLRVPAVSIAFLDHGVIAWTVGQGFADVAAHRVVTSETLFQAGSISKPVTALAALRLVQDGSLSLDEDVNQKLRSWKVPENSLTAHEKVTLRRILSHTAGFNVHGFPGYAAGEPVPTLLEVLNGARPANTPAIQVQQVPGAAFLYSGGGYTVLQQLMIDVTGQAFQTLVRDAVLQPARMSHSTLDQPLPSARAPEAALPYDMSGRPIAGGWHTYAELAAAGLWTTPSDLIELGAEIMQELAGQSSRILNQTTAREAMTPQVGGNGLGFSVEGQGALFHFSHGGVNAGYVATFVCYPAFQQCAAIMTNSAGGNPLIGEIMRALEHEYGWSDVPAAPVGRPVPRGQY
jgi:CubicO group peptidase (beta-lactamase class C family)